MSMEEVKRAREAAIKEALQLIEDGMVIGFGTGTTVAQLAEELAKLMKKRNLNLSFIPSSLQSKELILQNQMRLTTLDEYPRPDLTIDSFDQVDGDGNVIKGGGAALLREKVLAQAARKVVYIGDYLKLVETLSRSVPIEVLEYAYPHVERTLREWGAKLQLRKARRKAGPVISDNGNPIADADLGPIQNPEETELKLKRIAGVIETGIFPRPADVILIGNPDGTVMEIKERRKIL